MDQSFYFEDCELVGVKPGRPIGKGEFFEGGIEVSDDRRFALSKPPDIPDEEEKKLFDITNVAMKDPNRKSGCYYNDKGGLHLENIGNVMDSSIKGRHKKNMF